MSNCKLNTRSYSKLPSHRDFSLRNHLRSWSFLSQCLLRRGWRLAWAHMSVWRHQGSRLLPPDTPKKFPPEQDSDSIPHFRTYGTWRYTSWYVWWDFQSQIQACQIHHHPNVTKEKKMLDAQWSKIKTRALGYCHPPSWSRARGMCTSKLGGNSCYFTLFKLK